MKQKQSSDEIFELQQELNKALTNQDVYFSKNQEYELLCEKMKNELQLKNGIIEKLEIEVNDLNKLMELKKVEHLSQINKVLNEHKEQRIIWDNNREQHFTRIQELDRGLRQHHSENQRLKQDYQRLAELLQSSLSKSIIQTFTDHQFV